MGFFIGLALFIGVCTWGWIADDKRIARELKDAQDGCTAWLADQDKLPKYCIQITTKSGKILMSEVVEARSEIEHWFRWTYFKSPSKERAQDKVDQWMKLGRAKLGDLYIPTCDMETVQVVEYKPAP